MNKRVLITIIFVFAVMIVLAVIMFQNMDDEESPPAIKVEIIDTNAQTSSSSSSSSSGGASNENVIEISSSGFSPNTLTISSGETVIFRNTGTTDIWPASAVHPTHKVYPGSDIDKCGTSEESSIFDACRGIGSGERYTFTFNQIGTWRYHDHLKPGSTGTIIVT